MFTSNSVRFALGAWFHSGHSARKDKTLRRAPRGAPGVTLELLEARELFAAAPVLDSSAHSTVFGQGITLTALLAGGSGVVTFLDGTSPLGTGTLDPAGKATIFTSSLAVGTHSITASHDGAASAPVTQVVNPA